MSLTDLTNNDCLICISALEYYIDFVYDYIKSHKYPNKQAYANIALAKDTIQIFKQKSEKSTLSNVRITVAALSLLKQDIAAILHNLDTQSNDIEEGRKTIKLINHALRYFKALCENQGIDFQYTLLDYVT